MPITPLTPLDRTSPTFREEVDVFFGSQLPAFVGEANNLAAEIIAAGAVAGSSIVGAYFVATGGPVTYAVTIPDFVTYIDGMTFDIHPAVTCGTSPTINLNGIGSRPIFRELSSGGYVQVALGEMQQYHNQRLTYLSYISGFVIRGSTAKRYKTLAATRSMTAASGIVSYTGIGFKPTKITAYAAVAGTKPFSIGVSATGATDSAYSCGPSDAGSGTNSYLVTMASTVAAAYQLGAVTSMDADGFTLSWTLTGSPAAGTADIKFVCEE